MTTAVKIPTAVSAIAGVAIDQLHEYTVQQIDQWTAQIRQKLGAATVTMPGAAPTPAPAPTAAPDHALMNGGRVNGAPAAAASAEAAPTTSSAIVRQGLPLVIGAIIGAVVAATVIEKMKSAKVAANQEEDEGDLEAHRANSEDDV